MLTYFDKSSGLVMPVVIGGLDEGFAAATAQASGHKVTAGSCSPVMVTMQDGSRAPGWKILLYGEKAGGQG
jgi:hypothetical protein